MVLNKNFQKDYVTFFGTSLAMSSAKLLFDCFTFH